MLTIDYANCLSSRVHEHGLDPARFAPGGPYAQRAAELTRALEQTRGTGWERWRLLAQSGPGGTRDAHLEAVKRLADDRLAKEFRNLVVLGIGGSALGNIALHAALNPSTYNLLPPPPASTTRDPFGLYREGPRLFVIDNVDPYNFAAVMKLCPPEATLYNVISKSGETAETAAQFLIIREQLEAALGRDAATHIVAVTDPEKGTMRRLCDEKGYDTLPVPDGVGGRFSVLSPVGLFSAAMTGIDIDALLSGAHDMETRCRDEDLSKNPAATLATILTEFGCHEPAPKTNHVLMPYANGLYLMADWFRQLWAESLGKRHDQHGNEVFAGYTPIKALGATDQHSQIQLYREGPNDKVIGFCEVDSFGPISNEVTMPPTAGVEALAYLEGQPMHKLLGAEKRATEFALIESKRPNFTIRFPQIDAHHVGEFIMLWQVATAYAGLILNIDAYDQPAVETGKKATFGLMGREGYNEWQAKVDAALAPTQYTI